MTPSLDEVVVALIHHARARCGAGFGQYPTGVRHAIAQLLPMVNQDARSWSDGPTIREAIADLDERLSR